MKSESGFGLAMASQPIVSVAIYVFRSTPFFTNVLQKYFSINSWSVFHLPQTALDGFDQNWAKSGPLLFVTLEIIYTMDRPRVEWFNQEGKWRIQTPLEY